MEKFATENLVLLEFLVDRVALDPEITDNIGGMTGETCVSFQFLDNAPLYVCEEDFAPKREYTRDCGNLKNGKSCLFSLTPQQAADCTKQFDVFITIFKKMKPGVLPDQIRIGESLVSITNLFNELVDSMATCTDESPVAKTLKDCFKVTNPIGDVIGDISVYVRMSCFGKLIVTQFQMNLEDKSVQFKAKEGHYLFRYNKSKGGGNNGDARQKQNNMQCPQVPCPVPNFRNMQCPEVPCPMPQTMDSYTSPAQTLPNQNYGGFPGDFCSDPQNSPCLPQQPNPYMQPAAQQMCYAPPKPACILPDETPPGCYQEIGAQMGPNALTIRVHKDSGKVEKVEKSESEDGACSCTVENFGKKPPRKQNRLSLCETPCNDPQNLAMRPGVPDGTKKDVPFSFKMAGCGRAQDNNVVVVPPCATAPDGTQYTEISDPDRDVFILRIGKKSEGTDKKNNLELELCTPKGPDLKPPPKKETRDTQYNECDIKEEGKDKKEKGKKGKKGGKGGKGGKGKKGGKGGKGKKKK